MARIFSSIMTPPNESFSSRIFFFFTIFIILISVSFTAFFFQQQRKSLKQSLANEGELLAKLLAHNSRFGVFTENEALLRDPVDGIMQHKEVLFVSIQTLDGKLLKEEGRNPSAGAGKTGITKQKPEADLLMKSQRPRMVERADTFEFRAPVVSTPAYPTEEAMIMDETPFKAKERTIGFVRLIIDKKPLNQRLQALLVTSVLLALVFLGIGSIITYFIVKGITQPLNRLTEGVRALGGGGNFTKIPVETGDEIGNLAIAFNAMADSLQKREAEKQQLEEQLRNSQKMEAIGTLAGGVAHDFNNLLTAIMGFGTLLQLKLEEGTSLRGYANQILAAGDRATALTKRLLDFSRKQIINPRPMNLNTIIRNLEGMLERIISEDVEFNVELAEEDLVVMTDPGLIDQVIINLASNGRDAMPDGGALTVRTKIAELHGDSLRADDNRKPGRYALITVTDTGSGMAEETRKRVFDPFFTTKEVGKGTGLGLSMVYGIVQQHDGFIRVESTPGRGTTFQIHLPLIDSQVEERKPETALFPRGNNETVLVAEDNKLVMALTREILETNGYRIIEAADGEEAVARFMANADKIDMVLLDVIMPKKNGKEVFAEFTKIKPDIRALFMSGYTFDVISRQGGLEEGVNIISKPVSPGELLQKMRDTLQDRA
jgi:signal transduction histidine kinase/CheY-like chemotaxis protein